MCVKGGVKLGRERSKARKQENLLSEDLRVLQLRMSRLSLEKGGCVGKLTRRREANGLAMRKRQGRLSEKLVWLSSAQLTKHITAVRVSPIPPCATLG